MYNHSNRFHREALCNSKNVYRNTYKYNPLVFFCSLQDKKFTNSPFQLVALKKTLHGFEKSEQWSKWRLNVTMSVWAPNAIRMLPRLHVAFFPATTPSLMFHCLGQCCWKLFYVEEHSEAVVDRHFQEVVPLSEPKRLCEN